MAKHEISWLESCPVPLNEYQKNILQKFIADGPSKLDDDELETDFPVWAVDIAQTKRTITICMGKAGTKINGVPEKEIEKCLIKGLPKMSFDDITVYTKLKKLPRRE